MNGEEYVQLELNFELQEELQCEFPKGVWSGADYEKHFLVCSQCRQRFAI